MHILIIGNGITGVTCARYIRKMSDHKITIISAETKHFFSRTALMYIYMGHLTYEQTKPYEDWFWEKNRIDLVQAYVEKVDFSNKKVALDNGKSIQYDKLVLAVGSASNKFGWPGQDLEGVQGLYNMQDLVKMEQYTNNIKHAVVIGGGLIGIEMVEMLLSRRIPVTFLVREKSFWDAVLPPEESALVTKHIYEHHVDLRLGTELKEILADENGRAKAVITNTGEEIPCQFVGLTVGVHPNVGFLRNSELSIQKGIIVNRHLETNIPDVYAAGDCAQFSEPLAGRRPIEQVWYTGRMQGATVAHNICGKQMEYKPRTWFNSAKFFDIEYHTYGTVWKNLREGEKQLYWEHEDGKKCIKIVYAADNEKVIGINTFGIRSRHDVWEEWLNKGKDLRYVLEHLVAANFDPEFYKKHEQDIVDLYNQTHPNQPIQLKKKRSLLDMIFG